MTPTEYYFKLIESEQILPDEQQANIIAHLERIYHDLVKSTPKKTFLSKLTSKNKPHVRGLYLWGDVGIGKTFLMDCFYYCLPFKEKQRLHFHAFMKMVHKELDGLKHEHEPLKKIAKKIAANARILCLDELIVNDITDAMLLANLFDALYQESMCLIFTSNAMPDNLYLKGIQRKNFLPAIALIKEHAEVVHIRSATDYRLRHYAQNTFYFTPLGEESENACQQQFNHFSQNLPWSSEPITVNNRLINLKKVSSAVVWFDFKDICGIPRSQDDYLALAERYEVFLISNLPVIHAENNDLARAFINLIDVLYDTKKILIISAEKPIDQIYSGGRMLFEFCRTRSRLREMQTDQYRK